MANPVKIVIVVNVIDVLKQSLSVHYVRGINICRYQNLLKELVHATRKKKQGT